MRKTRREMEAKEGRGSPSAQQERDDASLVQNADYSTFHNKEDEPKEDKHRSCDCTIL